MKYQFKRLTGRQLIAMLRRDDLTLPESLACQRELSLRRGVRHQFNGRKANQRVYARTVGGEMGGDFMPPELQTVRSLDRQSPPKLSRAERQLLKAQGKVKWQDSATTVNRKGKKVPFRPKALSQSDPAVKEAAALLAPFRVSKNKAAERARFEAKMAGYLSKGVEKFKTVGEDGADESDRPPVIVTETPKIVNHKYFIANR